MSFNRENMVWQSASGNWNRGFYKVLWTGEDPEWDVEYDYSAFEWVSTGHRTEESAYRSWNGANPGGHDVLAYSPQNAAESASYDEMVWAFRNPVEAAAKAAKKADKARRDRLKKYVVENNLATISSASVCVRFGKDRSLTQSLTGYLREKDGWFGFQESNGAFIKVFSATTHFPAKNVQQIEKTVIRRRYW